MPGSLSAVQVEPWLGLVLDTSNMIAKVVVRDDEAKKIKGWLEQSDHFVVVMKRRFVGLQSWANASGDESTEFDLYVGNGVTIHYLKAGSVDPNDQFVCVKDKIEIEDHITGAGWQEQVWELVSKSVPVAGSQYEETVT
jgi:hypothetical protein